MGESAREKEQLRRAKIRLRRIPLPLALAWRRDNTSPLLIRFVSHVRSLPDVQAVNTR